VHRLVLDARSYSYSYSVRQDGTRTRVGPLDCTTASWFVVSDNRDAAIDDELSSTTDLDRLLAIVESM
jgi:hypothetical protein